jgi:hypothetical protein
MGDELGNPALVELQFLVGEWEMTLSEASFLADPTQTVTGRVVVETTEAGTLLVMRHFPEPSGPPQASWVIGRDAPRPVYTVLYADDRVVSRVYEMTVKGDDWRIWRDDPEFSQRFEATIGPDRGSIAGRWERRPARSDWQHDFNIVYTRLRGQG